MAKYDKKSWYNCPKNTQKHMPRNIDHGVGAIASVLLKQLHPQQVVKDKFVNADGKQRLEGCIELEVGEKLICGRRHKCIVLQYADFENVELYAVKQ